MIFIPRLLNTLCNSFLSHYDMRLHIFAAKSMHSVPQLFASNSLSSRNYDKLSRNSISPCKSTTLSYHKPKPLFVVPICSSNREKSTDSTQLPGNGMESAANLKDNDLNEEDFHRNWNANVKSSIVPSYVPPPLKLSLTDQAFLLVAFIACTTSIAFTSLVIAAVPTLMAMRKAATSLSKLADAAREELPTTMAAIRLSGMEISNLTLELSDLSHEIADGVNKSAKTVQAAEAGIRHISTLARQQTMSMIQERADLPIISLKPVVAGAARKTSNAVGRATKTLLNIISRRELSSGNEGDGALDRLDI